PETVILLRHQNNGKGDVRTPYELWCDSPEKLVRYQSWQAIKGRQKFSRARYWAAFVATPDGRTMFVGMYVAKYKSKLEKDSLHQHKNEVQLAGSCDVYDLEEDEQFKHLAGKLFVEWGEGARAWVQHAEKRNKFISELHWEFKEEDFPGYLHFQKHLSDIERLPTTWVKYLEAAKGVYLLTCPRTRELYVGAAYGGCGFLQRWKEYVRTGHCGNVRLKSRKYSDYQVTILEVAGSAAGMEEIVAMESRWKRKLQSREMGLNAN
ncbi:MAG: GIY-YIG nuclease family protein, partial [Acidobacteriota bacterium]|nr:GIY-YIG nuclease family protein [Acidobacteriota bacterium]